MVSCGTLRPLTLRLELREDHYRMSRLLSGALAFLPPRGRDWLLEKRHTSPVLRRLAGFAAILLRNREVEIVSGPAKGLLIDVGDSAAAYVLGNFKQDLQEFLSASIDQDDVFYDIGANVGFFSLLAARLTGRAGQVVAFEPLPDNILRLTENIRRNGFSCVKVEPFALGATNEERTFQVSERPTWGKLAGAGSLPDKYVSDTKVSVRRLDDLLLEATLQPPHFMKIDVEGAEAEVIEGARETILRYGPILMIEMHGTAESLLPLFNSIGYCAVPLNPKFASVMEAHWNAMIVAFPSEQAPRVLSSSPLRVFP